jgi:hypothetical protein
MMKCAALSMVHDVRNTRAKEKAELGRRLSQVAARITLVSMRRKKGEEERKSKGEEKKRRKGQRQESNQSFKPATPVRKKAHVCFGGSRF